MRRITDQRQPLCRKRIGNGQVQRIAEALTLKLDRPEKIAKPWAQHLHEISITQHLNCRCILMAFCPYDRTDIPGRGRIAKGPLGMKS